MNVSPENIEKMSSAEVDEIIRGYFTEKEWQELPDVEKLRNRLIFVNLVAHPEEAHLTPIPPFLNNAKGELFLNALSSSYPIKKQIRRKKKTKKENNEEALTPKKSCSNSSEKARRNPERSSKMKTLNYQEAEIPEDDRYIFCDKCQKEVLDYCETCGTLVVVKDVQVPVGVPDRARKTVPSIFKIHESTLHGLGVFVKQKLPQGIQLGPYEGTVTRISNTNGYSWKLRDGKLVDAADETVSNWMRYVNCAPHSSAQNLVAFQYKGKLFYRTARTIQEGEELLVYYGNSFAKELGIEPKKYFDPQIETPIKSYYTCKFCQIGLTLQKFRDAHEKRCSFRNKEVYYMGETFACAHCNVLHSSKEYMNKHQKWCKKKYNCENRKAIYVLEKEDVTYVCHKCNYETKYKSYYKQHLLTHDKENLLKYQCSKCPYFTICKTNLISHVKIHGAPGFICHCCAKSFNQKLSLDNHYLSRHSDKSDKWKDMITHKINECLKCTYKTVITSHFKDHLCTHESATDRMQYHCRVCGYKSIKKSNFTTHLRIHIDQLPFVCTSCRKRFNGKQQLDGHIVSKHSDMKQLMSTVTNKVHHCDKCRFKAVHFSHFRWHLKSCKK